MIFSSKKHLFTWSLAIAAIIEMTNPIPKIVFVIIILCMEKTNYVVK